MNYPYLTDSIPGIGGQVRVVPEDFQVQEVPLYQPLGIGEHTYFEIEKVGLTTYEAVNRLGRALKVRDGEFGIAGLKDRHAVARQVLSVRGQMPEDLLGLSLPGLRICWAKRHVNKLRIGHLKGNAFHIRVREVDAESTAEAASRAREILAVLSERGVPNYFGEQRFGGRMDNHLVGRALVFRNHEEVIQLLVVNSADTGQTGVVLEARQAAERGDYQEAMSLYPARFSTERRVLRSLAKRPTDFAAAVASIGKNMLWLYVSSYQSFLFNQCLEQRLSHLDEVFEGDLAVKHVNGAVFRVENAQTEQLRAEAFEISPSGPLFGKKMIGPDKGLAKEIEDELIRVEGITPERFDKVARGVSPKGARRALRFPLEDLEVEAEEDCVRLSLFLPRGSYATAVLREIMKVDTPELAEVRVEG